MTPRNGRVSHRVDQLDCPYNFKLNMRERMKARYQCYRQGKEAYNDIAYVSVRENVSKILKNEDEECLIRENVRLIRDREPNLIREKTTA